MPNRRNDKILFLIVFLFAFSLVTSLSLRGVCQSKHNDEVRYNNCVKDFYRMLFGRKNGSDNIKCSCLEDGFPYNALNAGNSILPIMDELTGKLSMDSIFGIINKARVQEFGNEFAVTMELKISPLHIIRFDMIRDTPLTLDYVWLNSGLDLVEVLKKSKSKSDYLLHRIGIISDPDGFVNIRLGPSKDAKIIGKIHNEEFFYYTPVANEKWWRVSKNDDTNYLGYVYAEKILPYPRFPKKMKEKVMKNKLD